MDITTSFFNILAQRLYKENDLSDVTWTMCQTSPAFMELWVHFFFPGLDLSTVESIEREIPDSNGEGSRVDFLINIVGQKPYLIEVKIWDQNHHFGQYEKAYGVDKDRLGYITNYPHLQEGYDVKQWRDFYQCLINAKGIPEEEAPLIASYCEYLRNVCGIIMIEGIIDIEKMSSLYDLTMVFHELANGETEVYDTHRYKKDFSHDAYKYTCLIAKYKNMPDWGTQYPIIGIWYDKKPRIIAGFYKYSDWCKAICDFLNANRSRFGEIKREYCSAPEASEGFFFYLSDEYIDRFKNASSSEEQRCILRSFLDEVLRFPAKLYALLAN